jgi:oxalate---CoA ligase
VICIFNVDRQPYVNAPEGIDIFLLVDRLCKRSTPLVYLTGYLSTVIVSAVHLTPWTVVVRDKPLTRILPRRWMDIRGMRMTDVWEAGLRAVIGIIVFRPGITQVRIRACQI